MIGSVRVETKRPGAQFNHLNLTDQFELVENLVHRFERHHRHYLRRGEVHGFGGWVCRVVVQQAKNKLALGRYLQSTLAEQRGELGW